MTQQIAPNNQYEASHFIEVYSNGFTTNQQEAVNNPNWRCVNVLGVGQLKHNLAVTIKTEKLYTVCLFKIRPNKLPTKHNFNK